MTTLRILGKIFLFPGTLMLNMLNVSVENDGGVFRSLINMIFWGFVCVMGALPFMLG